MKVRLIADQLGPNKQFDRRRPAGPDNPINVVVPEGTIKEGPEVIYLVINEQAVPVDEEAKQAYAYHLEQKEKALLASGRQQRPAIPFPAPASAPATQDEPVESAPTAEPKTEPEPQVTHQVEQETPSPAPAPPVASAPPPVPAPHPAARTEANVTPAPLRGLQDLSDAS